MNNQYPTKINKTTKSIVKHQISDLYTDMMIIIKCLNQKRTSSRITQIID